MGTRLQLHQMLSDVLGTDHVYFQPPASVKMRYPCIVYQRTSGYTRFADDRPYKFKKRYQVTYIDSDPDSEVVDRIAMLPMCTYDRHYTSDNLNHDTFNLYF